MAAKLKSFRLTGHLPGEIEDLVNRRIKDLRYGGHSAYVNGLVIFDLFCKRDHKLTGPLMREPQWVRDEAIVQLVKTFDDPNFDPKRPGGWFERLIEDIVEDIKKKGQPADEKKPKKKRAVSEVK